MTALLLDPPRRIVPDIHDDATRREFIVGGVAAGLLTLAGCGSDDDVDAASPSPSTTAGNAAFPVTIEHKFGEIVIESEPKRIVTLGLTDQDPVLALGVMPVASAQWFEERVVYPWSADAAAAAGGPEPEILPNGTRDVERVAALEPDLIVAIFSYITEEEYEVFSQIAPTLVGSAEYPNDGTPWQEVTATVGEALGREERAVELVEEVEARFAEVARRNPQFEGATAVPGAAVLDGQVALFPSGRPGSAYQGGVYGGAYVLQALGFEVPPEFDSFGDSTTTPLVSAEQFDLLDQDVLVWDAPRDSESARTLYGTPTYSVLEAVQEGRDVFTTELVGIAMHFSTVLSLPYVMENIEPQLAAALDGDPSTSTEPEGG